LHRDGLSDPVGSKLDFLERARAAGFFVTLVFIVSRIPESRSGA